MSDPSPKHDVARARFERFEHLTELPLAFLALLIVPALILEEHTQNSLLREMAVAINWVVWLAFCAEYIGKLALAPSRSAYVRKAWFDLLIIALSPPFLVPDAMQGARAIRILRLLRFVRAGAVAAIGLREASQALRHRKFHYVALTTVVVIGLGAISIFVVEHGHNDNIQSIGDAFWWAIVTTTTVGYGDVSPVTTEGRFIAVVLMVVGIGFIGVFTATVTSFFLESRDGESDGMTTEQRLTSIEAKLDSLLRQGEDRAQPPIQRTNK